MTALADQPVDQVESIRYYTAIRTYLRKVHGNGAASSKTGAILPRMPRAEAMIILGVFLAPLARMLEDKIGKEGTWPHPLHDDEKIVAGISIPDRDAPGVPLIAWLLGKPLPGDRLARTVAVKGQAPVVRWLPLAGLIHTNPFTARRKESIITALDAWDAFYSVATAVVTSPNSTSAYAEPVEVELYMSKLYALVGTITFGYFNWQPSVTEEIAEKAKEAGRAAIDTVGDVAGGVAEGVAKGINTISEGFLSTIGFYGAAAIVAFLVLTRYKLI